MTRMGLGRVDLSEDWRRLRSGWSAVSGDAQRLVIGLRCLQAAGACGTGHAHLAGRCGCARASQPGPPPPDCVRLLHILRWTLDTVMDDALHLLDVAARYRTSGRRTPAAEAQLREALLGVAQVVSAIEATVFGLRVRCRPELLRVLKDRGEVLLISVNRVMDHLGQAALEEVES